MITATAIAVVSAAFAVTPVLVALAIAVVSAAFAVTPVPVALATAVVDAAYAATPVPVALAIAVVHAACAVTPVSVAATATEVAMVVPKVTTEESFPMVTLELTLVESQAPRHTLVPLATNPIRVLILTASITKRIIKDS